MLFMIFLGVISTTSDRKKVLLQYASPVPCSESRKTDTVMSDSSAGRKTEFS